MSNLNPVEVNVTSAGGGGTLPFASLRLVEVGPLARAPQALSEIGRHIQVICGGSVATGATKSVDRDDGLRLESIRYLSLTKLLVWSGALFDAVGCFRCCFVGGVNVGKPGFIHQFFHDGKLEPN